MATAALGPRVTSSPPPRHYGAVARTMVLQDCISGEAREGEGQPRCHCAVLLRPVTADTHARAMASSKTVCPGRQGRANVSSVPLASSIRR